MVAWLHERLRRSIMNINKFNTEEKAKIIFIKAQEKLKKDEEYDIEHAVAFYIINKWIFRISFIIIFSTSVGI